MMLGHGAGVGGGAGAGRGGARPFHGNGGGRLRKEKHFTSTCKGGVSGSFWMMMLWFGSWFVAGGWRGSGEAAAEHADGAVQQAGAAGLQRVPGRPAQVRADSAADHRRGEY